MTHFHNTKYQYTHKRPVKRIGNTLDVAMTNAEVETVLHQVEDRETLVRVIIQLNIRNVINNAQFTIAVFHEPRGITVQNVSDAQELDEVLSKVLLWKWRGGQLQSIGVTEVFVDLKSMRKVETGDQITMRSIADSANSGTILGIITLFFKES